MKLILILMTLFLYGCVNPLELKQGDCLTFYDGKFPKYIDIVVKVDEDNYLLPGKIDGTVLGGGLDKMKFRDYTIYRKVSCPKELVFTNYDVQDMRNQGTLTYIVDMVKETKKDWRMED